MSIFYCYVCDRRVQYLDTPLYIAIFKCLFKEYNFTETDFIKYIPCHTETGTHS